MKKKIKVYLHPQLEVTVLSFGLLETNCRAVMLLAFGD